MAWRKTDFPEPQAALCEAAGLRWLADVPGGARAAAVYHAEPGYLELEQIRSGPVSQQAAEHFGSALARTHAAGAAHFGQFPHDGDGFIGQAPLPAVGPRSGSPAEPESRPESRPESEPESGPRPESEPEPESEERWGPFYAEYRVLPFGRKARDHGLITSGDAALIDRLATRLANGVF